MKNFSLEKPPRSKRMMRFFYKHNLYLFFFILIVGTFTFYKSFTVKLMRKRLY
ncbi:hypothetical protein LEP1GSC021_2985 [Leptospira noguchii str. 1993005606]|uniref:Uncharacterized protein n=2 Tax=Leptospira noguchii TaxID=28182 RepID=M6Y781_9LEPT|nr:hypothetical protein LEP1GSC041_4410 [Leptospira noguchii str. 2006001870]EMM98857.1 hypothetical protein LEP1GSC035_4762 [Leptospira noguchii str. 2007001578]EMO90222.1 hypothetical protein LEP1GSC024_1407 [Leptospira noguchii str. 2001034031]EPE83675.1 hypothetical protein LEP1GSC021_2985 [Leptospira noguchii str. 1993005606]